MPALTTSLRGLVDAAVEFRVLDHGLRSGTFGGPALEAVTLLARLITSFHNDDGEVSVAGLPAAGDPALDISEEQYRADSGLRPDARLGSITSRLWTKPALSVIGLDAPGLAVASDTLPPAARAKISLRLAPGTDPGTAMEALRRHVQEHAPLGADVRFIPGAMTAPFAAATGAETARSALWAIKQAWGVDPVEMGGSAVRSRSSQSSRPGFHTHRCSLPAPRTRAPARTDPVNRTPGRFPQRHPGRGTAGPAQHAGLSFPARRSWPPCRVPEPSLALSQKH